MSAVTLFCKFFPAKTKKTRFSCYIMPPKFTNLVLVRVLFEMEYPV
jgi:hypothetical protein